MGITKKVIGNTFEQYIVNRMKQLKQQYIRALVGVGIETVNYIVDRSGEASWFDDTGNLRSSIGFVILDEGKIIERYGFKKAKNGAEGVRIGMEFSEIIASRVSEFSHGLVLIIVAGMEYAAYVEAMENKDVLASSKFVAKRILEDKIREINRGQ